jgi:hypothetical protein
MDKKQKGRYSDAEMSLIKNTFAENDALVNAIRKVLFQLELTVEEQSIISMAFTSEELHKLVSKAFLPQITADVPLLQIMDMWLSIDLKGHNAVTAYAQIKARELVIKYFEQQVTALRSEVKKDIAFSKLIDTSLDEEKLYINVIARNTIAMHIDSQLFHLVNIAGMKEETVEQTKERLAKNSAK